MVQKNTAVQKLLSAWRAEPSIGGNIQAWQELPTRPAKTTDLPASLHPDFVNALARAGIHQLYIHQTEAWEHIQAQHNVIVVTGAASGKSLCYNLAVLDHLARHDEARALYLFPTKALAQDQKNAIQALLENTNESNSQKDQNQSLSWGNSISAAIYDGDTPASHRPTIRENVRLLLSNPDMLHMGILPHHTTWADFFRGLKFVVIDEAHVYRGVFGSHVANLVRRLKRIAKFYGARPQFILTSATIANPGEFAERLIEGKLALVTNDGAARGPQQLLIYNPPVVDRDLGLRRSALQESVRLAEDLLAYDVQTIIFGRSRRTVELILTYLRERGKAFLDKDSQIAAKIRGYRSGYLPGQRREIERGLRQGEVRIVVATNALELGIDIGSMAAALLVGYPGTIAATRQQAGRAGRGKETSLAVLITTADPLDQFLAAHPEYIFDRPPEHALINPDNLLILLDHLRCAAFELPFQEGHEYGDLDPNNLKEFLDFFLDKGDLHVSGGKYFWVADQYPAQSVSLRSAAADRVTLQNLENGQTLTIGQVDHASAHWMVHPGAIYMHEGRAYKVEDLDWDQNVAWLRRIESDFYTVPRNETTVELIEEFTRANAPGATTAYGEIQVTTQVIGYRKVRWYTHENLGIETLAMPATQLNTTGYWLTLSEETVNVLRDAGLWRNDPNEYGPNWDSQRIQARRRDGFQCQVCGAPETRRTHDVHHKTPFRTFTSYLQANQLENLVTLCPTCHRRAETGVRVRSGLAGLAYVLRHLAPFFLMCDVGDLGVYADQQSPIGDGQPTVALYDQIPAGIGLSQRLFEIHAELVASARQLVAACECVDGCPSCVGPGGENGLGGKAETLAILDALVV